MILNAFKAHALQVLKHTPQGFYMIIRLTFCKKFCNFTVAYANFFEIIRKFISFNFYISK